MAKRQTGNSKIGNGKRGKRQQKKAMAITWVDKLLLGQGRGEGLYNLNILGANNLTTWRKEGKIRSNFKKSGNSFQSGPNLMSINFFFVFYAGGKLLGKLSTILFFLLFSMWSNYWPPKC